VKSTLCGTHFVLIYSYPQPSYFPICDFLRYNDIHDNLAFGEVISSPVKEFLSASYINPNSANEQYSLVLQLPEKDSTLTKIPQAGVIDFEHKKLIMCAILPHGKYSIYSCKFTKYQKIPWDAINNSLRSSLSNIDRVNSNLEDEDADRASYAPSIVISPSSPSAATTFEHDESDLLRLEIILKEKSCIHFRINGKEIGNSIISKNR
jgi:hypothetical protein